MDDTIQAERWRALESRVRKDVEEYERLTQAFLREWNSDKAHQIEERRGQVSRRVMYDLVLALGCSSKKTMADAIREEGKGYLLGPYVPCGFCKIRSAKRTDLCLVCDEDEESREQYLARIRDEEYEADSEG